MGANVSKIPITKDGKIFSSFCLWLLFLTIVTQPSSVSAYTKDEAKKELERYEYFSTTRKATKNREKSESNQPMQCYLGMTMHINTPNRVLGEIEFFNIDYFDSFRQGDVMISFNGKLADYEDLDRGFPRVVWDTKLEVGDTYEVEVMRQGVQTTLELECNRDRQTWVQNLSTFAHALRKYKGEKCLEDLKPNFLDHQIMLMRAMCRNIEQNRKPWNPLLPSLGRTYFDLAVTGMNVLEAKFDQGYTTDFNEWVTLSSWLLDIETDLERMDFAAYSMDLRKRRELMNERLQKLVAQPSQRDDSLIVENMIPVSNDQTSISQTPNELLETCASKSDATEKLLCFELATELMRNKNADLPVGATTTLTTYNDLFDAFADIDGVVNAGVRYEDYVRAVNELSKAVSRLERKVRRGQLNMSDVRLLEVQRCLSDYRNAATLWSVKMQDQKVRVADPRIREFYSDYPSIPHNGTFINVDGALSHIWGEARKRVTTLEEKIFNG